MNDKLTYTVHKSEMNPTMQFTFKAKVGNKDLRYEGFIFPRRVPTFDSPEGEVMTDYWYTFWPEGERPTEYFECHGRSKHLSEAEALKAAETDLRFMHETEHHLAQFAHRFGGDVALD
jgi:hypothetical protein